MVTKEITESNGVVTEDEFAVTTWSKSKDYRKPFKFKCPSGQMCLIHRLDMSDLLRLGIAENLDFMAKALMAVEEPAKDSEEKPEEKSDEDPQKSIVDVISKAGNYAKLEKTVNIVVLAGVLKPKLHDVPRDEAARQKGLNYIDDAPFEDRMALFSKIFDSEGLTTFREEQKDGVGDVADVTSVPLPTE
jgi:hypothetical protein